MIALLYAYGDWEAADVALKVEAIAESKGIRVFLVPKHSYRVNEKVMLQLQKCEKALLIVKDAKRIDDETQNELQILSKKNIPVYGFIPADKKEIIKQVLVNTNKKNFKLYDYDMNNITTLIHRIEREQIRKNLKPIDAIALLIPVLLGMSYSTSSTPVVKKAAKKAAKSK